MRKQEGSGKRIHFRIYKIAAIPAAALAVACIMIFMNIFGGNNVLPAHAQDLMKDITAAKVEPIRLNDAFIKSQADFSLDLFKQSITKGKNSLISPLSAYLALAMTANGADGNTLKEFNSVLGKYDISIEDIDKYCYSYTKSLNDVKSGKFNIVNSIWYRSDYSLGASSDFLQTNADYFGASAFKADFDSQTVNDINNWVKSNTDGLIDKIIDKIDPLTMMYLINTLYFEDDWQNQYKQDEIRNGEFKLEDGSTVSSDFMYSSEQDSINDDNAVGFIKPYKDGKYSFVALLPNEGISVDAYANSLTGGKWLSLIRNKADGTVNTGMPKFKTDYDKSLVEPLEAMGLKDCFDISRADFSKMNDKDEADLYIADIMHKTFLQVDGLGTKAGVVTAVEMATKSAPVLSKSIILDRPFLYAIVDNATGLPIFIGTMNDPQ